METCKVIFIRNPLDPFSSRVIRDLPIKPVHYYLCDFEPGALVGTNIVASINGGIIPDDQLQKVVPSPGDTVVFAAVIQGGGSGGGKDIGRTLAMIAVTAIAVVASFGVGGVLAGSAAGGFFSTAGWGAASFIGAAMAGTAVQAAGAMLVNAVMPLQTPGFSLPSMGGAGNFEASKTYGWNVEANSIEEGYPVPVLYGTFRVTPPIVGRYVSTSGDRQYLNLLFCLADHEIDSVSNIEINENSTASFSGISTDVRYGTVDQSTISYFQDTRNDQSVSRKLSDTYVTQEIPGNATEGIGVGIVFPGGIFFANNSGELSSLSLTVTIQYRQSGGTWTTLDSFTVTEAKRGAIRRFKTVRGLTAGSYEIRAKVTGPGIKTYSLSSTYKKGDLVQCGDGYYCALRNIPANHPPASACRGAYNVRDDLWSEVASSRLVYDCYLEYTQSIIPDDFAYPGTALLGLRALATDQLSGSLPKTTMLVTRSTVPVYNPDTGAYEDKDANNPAWACYDILHDSYYGAGYAHTRINYSEFETWADFCDDQGLEVNIYFDSLVDIPGALNKISSIGRATVVMRGTSFGVVVDKPDDTTQLFTMGNIVLDSFEESFLKLDERANAIEVSYFDANENYSRQTALVQKRGTITVSDELRKNAITLHGCTSRDLALRHARFLLNCNEHLIRTVAFEAGTDAIGCQVGDVIKVAHDIPQWGYSGRAVSSGVNTLTLDQAVTLIPGTTYQTIVRHQDDDSLEEQTLLTVPDPQTAYYFWGHREDYTCIERSLDSAIPSKITIRFRTYFDAVGSINPPNSFLLHMYQGNAAALDLLFSSGGLYVHDGGDWRLIAEAVEQRTWQDWKFEVDFSASTIASYLRDSSGSWELLEQGGGCSRATTLDDIIRLWLYDFAHDEKIAYVSHLIIHDDSGNLVLFDDGDDLDYWTDKSPSIAYVSEEVLSTVIQEVVADELILNSAWSTLPEQYDLYSVGQLNSVTKQFRVVDISRSSEMRRRITALEYKSEVYSDEADIPEYEASAIVTVEGVEYDEQWEIGSDGTGSSVLYIDWRGSAISWSVFYRQQGTTAWKPAGSTIIPSFQISGLVSGLTYEISIAANSDSADKGYQFDVAIQGKAIPPSNVRNFKARQEGQEIVLTWTHVPDTDLFGYEIRQGGGWTSSQIVADAVQENKYWFRPPIDGTYTFWIKAKDTTGIYSYQATQAQITVDIEGDLHIITEQSEFSLDPICPGTCSNDVVCIPRKPTSLLSYFSFTEISGATLSDDWGTNDGTITGASQVTGTVSGKALSFDGVDDYVSCGDVFDLGSNASDFSFCFWINADLSSNANQYVFNKSNAGVGYGCWIASNGTFNFEVNDGANSALVSTPSAINDGSDYFISILGDRDDKISLYLNDVIVASNAGLSSVGSLDNSGDFILGSFDGASGFGKFIIDEFRVYGGVLDSDDQTALYTYPNGYKLAWLPALTDTDLPLDWEDTTTEVTSYLGNSDQIGLYTSLAKDIGTSANVDLRLRTEYDSAFTNVTDLDISTRTDRTFPLDTDTDITSNSLLELYYRTSDDNVTWSSWTPIYEPVSITTRYYQFKLEMQLDTNKSNMDVYALDYIIDAKEREKDLANQTIDATGTTFSVENDFGLTILDTYYVGVSVLGSAFRAVSVDKGTSDFTIYLYDSNGNLVSGSVDIQVRGW